MGRVKKGRGERGGGEGGKPIISRFDSCQFAFTGTHENYKT